MTQKVIYNCGDTSLRCDLSENNTKIYSSYKVTNRKVMKRVLAWLQGRYKDKTLAVRIRTISDMEAEWRGHNLLYSMGLFRERTADLDLEYPQKWYKKVAWRILSLFYW